MKAHIAECAWYTEEAEEEVPTTEVSEHSAPEKRKTSPELCVHPLQTHLVEPGGGGKLGFFKKKGS